MLQIDRIKPGSSAQPAPPIEVIGKDDRISRALSPMEQNLARPVPILKIASDLDTGTRQLERLFNDVIGCTPQAAYLQLRLKHARWMLKSDLTLAPISADSGFSDGTHFGKAFISEYRITPAAERHRIAHEPGEAAATTSMGNTAVRLFDLTAEPKYMDFIEN